MNQQTDDPTAHTSPPNTASPPNRPFDEELARVNKQMYEQNVELAIRNKTLSILRTMYEIMNTSFGLVETCQRLAQAVVEQLNFASVSVALIDKTDQMVKGVATYPIRHTAYEEVIFMGVPIQHYVLSLNNTNNFSVSAMMHRQTRMTNFLYDILTPFVTEEQAIKIQEDLKIQTSIVYPITFAQDTLGVLILGLDKHIGDLSRSERETLHELIEVIAIAIERAQIYADLQAANEKLQEMDKLKDEFISITSHELRTPMTAIRSYLWMVLHDKAGPLDPKAQEFLTRVSVSTDRLINLVNDMLDVSRIESGRIQMKMEPVDMVKLAKDVESEFQARVAQRSIKLAVVAGGEIPQALADKEKTHQVLENLVGNAVKFTPDGGSITITVKSGNTMVETAVSDTGKGIAQEDMKRLFTKFGRLENSLVSISESGGTGLGLYISKQYINMQKGEIRVESELGKGTTFLFTLPKNG